VAARLGCDSQAPQGERAETEAADSQHPVELAVMTGGHWSEAP
jgi:hypothetical protein